MKKLTLVMVVGLLLGLNAVTQAETQTFDSEASASAAGWTEVGSRADGHDFGFSDTNNAEGASGKGEGGGMVRRTGTDPHRYYADLTVGGIGDLTTDLHATGKVKLQNIDFDGEAYFGWFDSVRAGMPASSDDVLGFRIMEPNIDDVNDPRFGQFRMRAQINSNVGPIVWVPDDTAFDFEIDWDADGHPDPGRGLLTVTFDDGTTQYVSTENDVPNMVWDGFGMMSNDGAAAPRTEAMNFWVDDLGYSVVPEPGTFVLAICGMLGFVALARRRRK